MLPFDVATVQVQAPIGKALKITIDWVDEFTTKELWGQIFDRYVKPKQESYWEERGDLRHSKQLEEEGMLRKPWVTELYERKLSAEEKSGRKIGMDSAINLVTEAGEEPPEGIDRSTAWRCTKMLDVLFKPRD
jgi:hypothetical protein